MRSEGIVTVKLLNGLGVGLKEKHSDLQTAAYF